MQKLTVFQISNSLPKPDCVGLAQGWNSGDKLYLVKTFENKRERHIERREKFILVRLPRPQEKVVGAYRKEVDKRKLIVL